MLLGGIDKEGVVKKLLTPGLETPLPLICLNSVFNSFMLLQGAPPPVPPLLRRAIFRFALLETKIHVLAVNA